MKIVYISNKPIYPLIDGGCVAMQQFLNCLIQTKNDVKHFCLSTSKHTFSEKNYPDNLSVLVRPESFAVNTKVDVFAASTFLLKKGSYNVHRFKNKQFNRKLVSYLTENTVDLIILESIYLGEYISSIRSSSPAKILIRSHNVEHQIWNRLADNERSVLKKRYYKKLASDLKKSELEILDRVDGIACISEQDLILFKGLGVRTPMTTFPMTLEKKKENCDYSSDSFFHLGAMNWNPNIEAVRHLVYNIFPSIRKQRPNAKLILAGSFMPEEFQSDPRKGIEVVGYINRLEDFMTTHGIMLSPLKSGSGVRIKFLEGMNLGVPIVTTKTGAEGINGQNNRDYLVAENDEEFISLALELHSSAEKRCKLGAAAKAFIEKNYQATAVTKKIIEFISEIS
jgi:polysaccharide biosynthesis protein PslH